MTPNQPYRLIISGGGTGGHIFPALAIAKAFRERHPDAKILFVGALGRMEMTRVPDAGYEIIGLWISGIQRKLSLSNLLLPIKLIASYFKASSILKKFKPHAVVGTGGYASGPLMMAATAMRIPSLIQEQNSFAGLANKQVAGKVNRICVAYEGMEKYFPKEKLVLTGNPVRKDLLAVADKRARALSHFGFDSSVKTLLVLGGSLGSRTINECIYSGMGKLMDANVQLIWQTGKGYFDQYRELLKKMDRRKIRLFDFVKEMDLAYAAADVVISRAGALAVSELCVAEKPCILVPSPNVAEDHQTKNAMALVNKEAAVMIADGKAGSLLVDEALKLMFDEQQALQLAKNIRKLAMPQATEQIVDELEKLIGVRANGSVVSGITNRAMLIS
ncbi:undecaprenyldiphospho-muramoylpentapeptide beta-N-acetylglucosaminyltransferase [Oscillatoria amoena NRMC-F 0135]|nr:undecaprenyldiphospho-muramoylpentapeptide beta-N-acetylglucosaminyltransferase [Oscillatoria amoena NRMC-F 0135]